MLLPDFGKNLDKLYGFVGMIILIEIIMAHEMALNGGRLITEVISDVHVHIYLGKEMTFLNTIIM